LRIKFHNLFFIFFIMLFEPHDLRIMLKGLTRVYSDCFLCLIFNWFFFQFYYSILDRLGIKFYNLFLFTFYEDILVSWPIKSFFIFFNFKFQYWFDWELDFIIYFDYFLWSYQSLITRIINLTCWPDWPNSIHFVVILILKEYYLNFFSQIVILEVV